MARRKVRTRGRVSYLVLLVGRPPETVPAGMEWVAPDHWALAERRPTVRPDLEAVLVAVNRSHPVRAAVSHHPALAVIRHRPVQEAISLPQAPAVWESAAEQVEGRKADPEAPLR